MNANKKRVQGCVQDKIPYSKRKNEYIIYILNYEL
nr:MAG TPA_asm: hypothetical protein [Caudoviricetes sp.]